MAALNALALMLLTPLQHYTMHTVRTGGGRATSDAGASGSDNKLILAPDGPPTELKVAL
jgi:hypothetical protein